jgi:hypothetical protein
LICPRAQVSGAGHTTDAVLLGLSRGAFPAVEDVELSLSGGQARGLAAVLHGAHLQGVRRLWLSFEGAESVDALLPALETVHLACLRTLVVHAGTLQGLVSLLEAIGAGNAQLRHVEVQLWPATSLLLPALASIARVGGLPGLEVLTLSLPDKAGADRAAGVMSEVLRKGNWARLHTLRIWTLRQEQWVSWDRNELLLSVR